jgi:DNA invertase Pin-like site-specific DNA recombinase
MTTALCWVLVVILFPVALLLWATESRHTRIQRLRRQGQTWKQIAARYGCSASTARRWATAA